MENIQRLNATSTNVSIDLYYSTPALEAIITSHADNSSMPTTNNNSQVIQIWTLFAVIGAFGIAGNALVALVLLRFTNMRRRLTNIYIINQSVIDCAASTFLLASTLYQDETLPPGIAGELKCRLWMGKVRKYTSNWTKYAICVRLLHACRALNSLLWTEAVLHVVMR